MPIGAGAWAGRLLECDAAGVPIASSNAGAIPEIAGDAAVHFDPLDPANIGRVVARIPEDVSLRAELREKALQQALESPTWDEVGQMTLRSPECTVDGS